MNLKINQQGLETGLKVAPQCIHIGILKEAITSTSTPSKPFLLGALRARQWESLLEWSELCEPQLYAHATDYFVDAQIAALIRKYPFNEVEIPGINPEETALKKFLSAEHRCKWVNRKRRAKRKRLDPYYSFWEDARKYIARVLGESPDLQAIYAKCDFTSGTSVGVHGSRSNVAAKLLSDEWTATPSVLHYATQAMWNNIHIVDVVLPGDVKCYDKDRFTSIVEERQLQLRYNKISFVPKTARTHRSIAVEPLLNGYVQKGTDTYMRELLLNRAGIDLSNQSKNRLLAELGSKGGFNSYCTLDLSAASDSIALEVVRDLLPPDWFRFLCDIRSPSYLLPDTIVPNTYEKFCSMGNGFCFPLESLIFASFSYAVAKVSSSNPYDFSIYGDDIIIRQSSALLLTEVLEEVGFKMNTEKSFYHGAFRESCGADWYAGQDVRPVILAKRLTDLREVIALHNSFLRSRRVEMFSEEIRSYLRALSPVKYFRPGREPGDTAFSVPLDVATSSPLVRWNRKGSRWSWVEIISKPVKDKFPYDAATLPYVEWLTFLRGAMPKDMLTLRYSTIPRCRRVSRPFWERHHGNESSDRPCEPIYPMFWIWNSHLTRVDSLLSYYVKAATRSDYARDSLAPVAPYGATS